MSIAAGGALLVSITSLYIIPSLIALFAFHHWGTLSCVAEGDAAGCIVFGILSGWRKGLLLYLFLNGIEAAALLSRLLSANTLVWATNLVPSIVVAWEISKRVSAKVLEEPEDL